VRKKLEELKAQLYTVLSPECIADMLRDDTDMARKEVEEILRRLATSGPSRVASRTQRDRLIALAASEVLGLGVIDHLLADPSVTEVMVNGPDQIYFEREGKTLLCPDSYASEEQLRTTIDRIISPLGRRIDEQNPMVNGRLVAGHRVNAVIPPISLSGSVLTIRKFSENTLSLEDMVQAECVHGPVATLLSWAVAAKQNIAVSGGTGSGKTTLLNALSLEIPSGERIITIEDSAELKFSRHPHVVRLEARPANLEGKGEISLRDLVINSLRMRPDRIVVGEVRGAEALEMLQAMNTGHDGSLTTLHANTPSEVVTRLITMVGYGVEQSQSQVESQIAAALDLIVHVQRCSDGLRRIVEVAQMSRRDHGGKLSLVPIYRFVQTGSSPGGRLEGEHVHSAEPSFVSQLESQCLAGAEEIAQWRAVVDGQSADKEALYA